MSRRRKRSGTCGARAWHAALEPHEVHLPPRARLFPSSFLLRTLPHAPHASQEPVVPVAQTAAWVERLYTTFGLVSTFTQAGRPEAKARSMAGRMSSGRFTSPPYPPD